MKLQQLSANQGALWVGRGFMQFLKYPLAFSALLASFFFSCMLLLAVPWFGGLLMLAALPIATLGFMIATHNSLEHRTPSSPLIFFQPFRAPSAARRSLLFLALAYALLTLLIIKLAGWVDGGSFTALQLAMMNEKTTQDELQALLQDPRLMWGMLIRFGLTCLLSLPFWHAPALAYWNEQPWAKAIFFSWIACWRNKGAFTVYGLTWGAVGMLFALLAGTLMASSGQAKVAALMMVTVVLMFSAVFYVSLYFTYADCFVIERPTEGEKQKPTDGEAV